MNPRRLYSVALRLAIASLIFCVAAGQAHAGSYRTGTVYVQEIAATYPLGCSGSVYDPDIFALATGDVELVAQGFDLNTQRDSFIQYVRDQNTGTWSVPNVNAPNKPIMMKGPYARCGYSPSGLPGPVASPSVVHLGDRYYMAFVGGNGDQITGKVYWAVSYDGTSWNVYNWNAPTGQLVTPVLAPYYHEECSIPPGVGSGVGQVELLWDGSYFYLYMRYGHFNAGQFLGTDTLTYRFTYDPNHPFGFGPIHQLWSFGQWINHSGQFVWTYDKCGGLQCPPNGSDPVLQQGLGQNINFGAGDIKLDAMGFVHFYQDGIAGSPRAWEYCLNLAAGTWTHGGTIDTTTITQAYPNPPSTILYYPGVYSGRVCPTCTPGTYIFVPLGNSACGTYSGLGIASAELIYTP
jgi:hypothetical protein